MQLRSFTSDGMVVAAATLDEMRAGAVDSIPDSLLLDDAIAIPMSYEIKLPKRNEITTRWQLGLWLTQRLPLELEQLPPGQRKGLWTWLAFYLFDLICPIEDHVRKVREDARYIFVLDDFRKRHRHLLAGPYLLFRAHPEDPQLLKPLLATRPDSPGDVYEQFASRVGLIQMQSALYAAGRLYWDHERSALRRGAAGAGPGSVRRLADVLMQFDLTYDLYKTDGEQLFEMLPSEFSKYKNPAR